ncbi:TM2 domain-containing protein [Paracoccus aestuariivivens]|uniref:NINE protein n=1 Tax=Paracoccus aestuariivivens TaxID=1820333 RepID=A0A6L6J906_9RHOB|nr:TM2 domain-containing protein [Paracoccus aestuariivivens]MTH77635.1 NINE protein [Paracoccus aestuariivivens]
MDTNREMLIEQRVANDAKSPLVAYLLAILLWGFGAHRMYLGRWLSGLIMLAMSGIGWLLSPVLIGWPLLGVVWLWAVIDLFLIPGMIQDDKDDIRRRLGSTLR